MSHPGGLSSRWNGFVEAAGSRQGGGDVSAMRGAGAEELPGARVYVGSEPVEARRVENSAEHFGTFLRLRREARGMSLAELSRTTKIKECYLDRLEAAELEALPAQVF